MIRLVLTDLDNTLIPTGAPHASARALAGIHAMLDAGLWFGPVSGRVPAAMRWMFDGDAACYQTGEPELGWRHLHDVAAVSARGAGCGPGVGTCDLNYDFACYSNIDFADSTAGFIRTVAEGVFGIVAGKEIRPSFPASWDEAEIKSPYISYRWTRKGGERRNRALRPTQTEHQMHT